ncbi:MAG: SDR family NAD(P)-dependent oxidoreductase [Leptospiraceae bacterium]|nr:SDR family NAD(P)-dependent oxidoreductase [Leptospiraceae bacterium]
MKPYALILGATSDIAKHIVLELAKKSYNLYLIGRNTEELALVQRSIEKYNVESKVYVLDILNLKDSIQIYNDLKPKPELVISALGYYGNQDLARENFEECYQTAIVNYLGVMLLVNHISIDFEKTGFGKIGVISSVAGIRGRQLNYIYGSSKAGISTYLSGLRNKLFKKNISITTILLGPVYTRMSQGHNLIPYITLSPETAARKIVGAIESCKDEVYIHWIWRFIMLAIKLIPETIFKRLPPF